MSRPATLEEAEAEAQRLMVRSPAVRRLLFAGGAVSLIVGLIGLLIPVFPTSPFLLITGALWARSSKRFYVWLLTHRWLGPPVADFRRRGCLELRYKLGIAGLLGVSGPLAFALSELPAVRIGVVVVALAMAAPLLLIPTCPGAAS